jgi:hypothetical protein
MKFKLFVLLCLLLVAQCSIYQKYYDEAYRIAVAMSLDQKIGQILQVEFEAFSAKNKTD